MPQAIPAAATAFASWVSGAVYAGATAVGISAATASTLSIYAAAAAYAAVGYAAQAAVVVGLGAVSQAQIPDVETGKIIRKQTRPLRNYPVGGTSRFGGAYMLRESKGNKFAGVTANCEGRLDRIDQVYINDDKVTLSGGFVQGMANERYGSGDLVRLETRLGLPTETHYSFLTADFGAFWPTTSRGDGIASIGWLAQHRSTESFPRHFPNGEIMPTFAGTPVCYDWRDVAQDREDPSTWQECWNPVVWLVHIEWTRHGRSWTRCIAPVLDDLTAEADYCDETVEGEARYRCAGNYPSNLMPDAVRGNILASMDGWMSVNGKGQLVVKSGRYVEPTFVLTADHIVGYNWRAFQVAEEAVTDLVVSYVSAAHEYSEVEAGTYSKDTPSPVGKSETLQLPWVPSPKQAMRLARRKMTRLDAERRGSVRSTIYGLNGLGQRFIRVQNPELASMADVVLEVMNVELDLARGQVVFDVILADTTIDDDEDVGTLPPPTPDHPDTEPGFEDPAEPTIGRDVIFPIESSAGAIDISAFNVVRRDGRVTALPADTLTGLADSTTWGVFWREDAGYEVEAFPAEAHMSTGSWLFLGWQATPDGSGNYPANPAAPGGWGGDGAVNEATLGGLAAMDTVGASQIEDGAVEPTKLADNAVDLAGAKVTGKSLANIDSAAATKLAGIQAGATDDSAVTALAGTLGGLAVKSSVAATDIDADAVTTAKVQQGSITPVFYANTTSAVLWSAETTEKTVQTQVVDVVRGGVRITGLIDLLSGVLSGAGSYGTLRLKRDGSEIFPAVRVVYTLGGAGTWRLPVQMMLDYLDTPGAGTFTYTLTFQPSEAMSGQVSSRSLFCQPLEG